MRGSIVNIEYELEKILRLIEDQYYINKTRFDYIDSCIASIRATIDAKEKK